MSHLGGTTVAFLVATEGVEQIELTEPCPAGDVPPGTFPAGTTLRYLLSGYVPGGFWFALDAHGAFLGAVSAGVGPRVLGDHVLLCVGRRALIGLDDPDRSHAFLAGEPAVE